MFPLWDEKDEGTAVSALGLPAPAAHQSLHYLDSPYPSHSVCGREPLYRGAYKGVGQVVDMGGDPQEAPIGNRERDQESEATGGLLPRNCMLEADGTQGSWGDFGKQDRTCILDAPMEGTETPRTTMVEQREDTNSLSHR